MEGPQARAEAGVDGRRREVGRIRIGIDHRAAHAGSGGIAVYARELARALEQRFPDDDVRRFEHTLRRTGAPTRRAGAALATRLGVAVERVLGPLDVFHLTDFARVTARAPVVATIHDVLFETLPDCYPPAVRKRLRAVTQALLRVADHVVVPALRVRDAVCERFGVPPERVHVTPLGSRGLPTVDVSRHEVPTVLVVGTLIPRKNHLRLVEAFAGLPQPARLVVAGGRGWEADRVLAAIERTPHVTYVEAPTDETLAGLYAQAHLVAVPSLDEGFGLPVVEALAMSKPVLVGRDTTCADIAGDAALAVDVTDVEAIRDGLRRLLADVRLAERLVARAPERAAEFTWAKTAEATRAVYARAVAERARTS